MNNRRFAATRRRASTIGATVLAVAFIAHGCQTIAFAQVGHATNQRPPQAPGTPNNLSPYGMPRFGGWYSPYPVKDPTADERAAIAGRVYRTIRDEWTQRAVTTPRSGRKAHDLQARSQLELIERLGTWSLRWQEAQDNAARSLAARYQAMADHLARMSTLEDGRFWRETGQAAAGPTGPKQARELAEVARFFRPIDEWDIDRIIPVLLQSERPLNPHGVAITPAEQVEIANRIYHLILTEAVDRFLASPRRGEKRADEVAIFDALLAERLGFWSDLCRQAQDVATGDLFWRTRAAGDRSALVPSAGTRDAGAIGPMATMRSHLERMRELENGPFVDDALKQTGRSGPQPVEMTRFREFGQVVHFFRIDAETQMPGAARPKGTDVGDAGQAATAGRIYRAIMDGAAQQIRQAPRAGETHADARLVFDAHLAERLAAWSIRWARAQIRANLTRGSQFNAVRSHVDRMASLEDGRTFRDALERAGPSVVGAAAPELPREFADVARFFRLKALWELAQIKSR